MEGKAKNRVLRYMQKTITSGVKVFKEKRHVTQLFSERDFSLYSDNKRYFGDGEKIGKTLVDSNPFHESGQCNLNRSDNKLSKNSTVYNEISRVETFRSTYNSYVEVAVRKFVRCLFTEEFGLEFAPLGSYKGVAEFINKFKRGKGVTSKFVMKATTVTD
jgi:hypothetical protein